MSPSKIGTVDKVTLTILVDNKANLIVKPTETIQYFTKKSLLAEHGFSVLIQLGSSDRSILWDAGCAPGTVAENMHRMALDPKKISLIALSHGHFDHIAGITTLLEHMDLSPGPQKWPASVTPAEIETRLTAGRMPIVAHPAAFRERWKRSEDGSLVGPSQPPPVRAWEAAGAQVIQSADPYQLAPGCWTTGYVPRNSFESAGRSTRRVYRQGAEFLPDELEDDQAIIFHIKDRGLVVLAGCAHAGIVNTIQHAKAISGIDTLYAVIGGFHLAQAGGDEINQTIAFIQAENPAYVVPTHCSGLHAISRFAAAFPESFVEGVVGIKFIL